jgi:hypothetical protein
MAKKQTKSKPAGKARKSPKSAPADAVPKAEKTPRTRERDPRLPAAGTVLTRKYKDKEFRVTVLEDGFRCDGKEYRSLTAIARMATGYPAISGPAWFGLAERAPATPKTPKGAEKPAEPPTPRAQKKGTTKVRRAGRDPQPSVTPTDAPMEPGASAEPATA